MILFVHIALSLAAIGASAASVTRAKRGKTYGRIGGLLLVLAILSGGLLAVASPAAIGHLCVSGVLFSVFCLTGIIAGARRRNRFATIDS